MKKIFILFFVLLLLLLSACGTERDIPQTPADTAAQSNTPAPTATPAPDFTKTDFSGRWAVSDVIDSEGIPISDAEKQDIGAGFMLELLPGGTYFVYDENGQVLGQGAYGVALNQLTLTAQGAQTVYEIVDTETLRSTQTDTSVTVMKREAD